MENLSVDTKNKHGLKHIFKKHAEKQKKNGIIMKEFTLQTLILSYSNIRYRCVYPSF